MRSIAMILAAAALLAGVYFLGRGDLDRAPAETGGAPARIVSLGPSFTEILIHLGARERLVAVTDFCQGVPDELPRVGTLRSPDLEEILGLAPDLVVGVASQAQAGLFEDLRQLGLRVDVLPGDSIDDIRAAVLALGRTIEAEPRAEAFVAELDARLSAPPASEERPSVAFVINHGPLFVAGGGSFVDDMLEAAGFRNAFGDVPDSWLQIDAERLVQREPAVIVDTTMPPESDSHLERWRPFSDRLDAVRSERVFSFPAVNPGVQIPGWIDRLAEIRSTLEGERASSAPGGKLPSG